MLEVALGFILVGVVGMLLSTILVKVNVLLTSKQGFPFYSPHDRLKAICWVWICIGSIIGIIECVFAFDAILTY